MTDEEKNNDIVHINITIRGHKAKKLKALMAVYNFESYSELIDFLLQKYEKGGKAEGLKKILNKYDNAKCRKCNRSIEIGETCFYDPTEHTVLCTDCYIKANVKSADQELKLKMEIEKLKIQKKQLETELKQYEKYKMIGEIIRELSESVEKYQVVKEEFEKTLLNLRSFSSEDVKGEINKAVMQVSQISKEIQNSIDQLSHVMKTKIVKKGTYKL